METICINHNRRQIVLPHYYFYRNYYKRNCHIKNQTKIKRKCNQNIFKQLYN